MVTAIELNELFKKIAPLVSFEVEEVEKGTASIRLPVIDKRLFPGVINGLVT